MQELDDPYSAIFNFLVQTLQFRYYLNLICLGIFEGAIIYFVIYYEKKVSVLYQLLALLWLPFGLWNQLRYGYDSVFSANIRYIIIYIGKYFILVGVLMILDYCLKNAMLKYVSMCVATIVLSPYGFYFLEYGSTYYSVNFDNIVHWILIIVTFAGLIYLRKKVSDKKCLKCGTDIISGDLYCRNCGDRIDK
jgi:hypothetical protein